MKSKKFILIIVIGLIFILSTALSYLYFTYKRVFVSKKEVKVSEIVNKLEPSPTPIPIYFEHSFLLLGYGGGEHEGGYLTDTIMAVLIREKSQEIFLVSIPRDLYVNLPVIEGEAEQGFKINEAYPIGLDDRRYKQKPLLYTGDSGGGELAKFAVSKVIGIPIDNFVIVSFEGFKKAIDVLGGVTVNVERSFDDFWYPIEGKEEDTCSKSIEEIQAVSTIAAHLQEKEFPCRFEQLHFDKGKISMDGDTALKYVRSRHSATEGNDFARAARQRNLILALKEKVIAIDFIPKVIPFINSLSYDLRTDIDLNLMKEMLSKYQEYNDYEIISLALTDQNYLKNAKSKIGQYILIPKEGDEQYQAIHDYIWQNTVERHESKSIDELDQALEATASP